MAPRGSPHTKAAGQGPGLNTAPVVLRDRPRPHFSALDSEGKHSPAVTHKGYISEAGECSPLEGS